jgi:hypothetical protein
MVNVDEHPEHSEYVWSGTIREAAYLLDTSVEAVRGRINREKYARTKDEDGTVYVHLTAEQLPNVHQTFNERSNVHALMVERADLQIADMREEISYLREELTAERNANSENRRIIARLTESLPQLESGTPPDTPESPESDRDASGKGTTPDESQRGTQRPSIWRRFFGQ